MEAMTSLSVGAVLEKMLGYERSCQQLSSNVPPVDSHDSQWFGVVFEIDEIDIVVSLNEVNSVLRPPYRITLVPKTKN